MGDLLHETTPPLAWDVDGLPFQPPEEAIAWRVREHTNQPGRPRVIPTANGPLHVSLDTDFQGLRQAIGKTRSYRLYPINRDGLELEPIAVVDLVDEEQPLNALAVAGQQPAPFVGMPAQLAAEIPLRFFDLFDRILTSRDTHDELLSRLLTTLVSSTSDIQQSTASLLTSANTTVKVANGVESLERAPARDTDIGELKERLAALGPLREQLAALGGGKPQMLWYAQVLTGPVGMGLTGLLNNFAQAQLAQAQAAQAQVQAARAQAQGDEQSNDHEED